jgi:DNA-binding SARP family transcriptional activator
VLASVATRKALEFRILGPLEVARGGRPLRLGGARQRSLLAILLLHANELVSRDRLIEELWGEEPPETAPSALRVHVAQLRKALSDGEPSDRLIVTRAPGYVLTLEPDRLDLHRFERLADEGSRALSEGRWSEASKALHEALALWRGPALADLAYEGFAQPEIARLAELRLSTLESRIEADLALGRHAEVIPELEALVAEQPLRELPRGQLMLALYRTGRQAEALALYRETRRALGEELGIDPSPALQQLESGILRQDPALEAPRGRSSSSPERGIESTRPITILVAEASEPDEEVLDLMVDAVLRHEGRVTSFERERILACFGIPAASEDDPERALVAALELRDDLGRRGLEAVVGVSTGEVHVAAAAPSAGRVISLAERLQASAAPGTILVSAATHRQTRLAFEFEAVSIDPGPVGAGPLPAYAVRRALPRPAKARGIEGIRAALRGRDAEVGELGAAVADVLAGRGRTVVLGGEAGVGKSRLVAELRALEQARELRWLEGRCRASGINVSYVPYVELLSEFFGWVPEDDDRERERSIVSSLLELVREGRLDADRVGELVSLLANLLSVGLSDTWLQPLDDANPEQLRHRTFAALREFLLALAGQRPLGLVLEDFHWADALSLDFTAALLERVPTSKLLLVCVSRPDPPHRWKRLTTLARQTCGDAYSQIELGELSPEAARELLYALVPIPDLPARTEELILGTSQGNPFFLEEILRELIDAGAVAREDGGWRVRKEIDSVAVPASVQAVVLSRVDRLGPGLRRVLEKAAVIGRSFPLRLLARLEQPPEELERALWELENRDLVYEDRVVPEEEYSFSHVLAQEAVYRAVPPSRRAELHQATAVALEALHPDDLDEHAEQLAYHYELGTVVEKAVEWLWRAGEKSRRAYLNADAADYLERGLALLEEAGPPDWRAGIGAALHESLGDILELTGKHDEAIASYGRALELTTQGELMRRAGLHRKVGVSLQIQRRPHEALDAMELAKAALGPEPSGDNGAWWAERAEIEIRRLWINYFFRDPEELAAAIDEGRPLVEARGTPLQRCELFVVLAAASLRRERYAGRGEGIGYARTALEAAEESGDLTAIASARFEVGFCLLWSGRPDEGAEEINRALALAERIGDVTLQSRCLTHQAAALRRLGDVEGLRALLPRVIAVAEAGGMGEYLAHAESHLAWVAWRDGDVEEARRHAGKAWKLWDPLWSSPHVVFQWMPSWPLIGLALCDGRVAQALEHVRGLLEPTRQPMVEGLQETLEASLGAFERQGVDAARAELERAAQLATREGYL